ncbi:unnamed protein product [Moneuplotes crassus]|uniref:USP domain-containing protein n=1 Tax=Euplotes crassus TaxID=5936 RepID=A0AAD1XCD9_EUPCR|nr:unnamed protein product [Moneuplotes crassus]
MGCCASKRDNPLKFIRIGKSRSIEENSISKSDAGNNSNTGSVESTQTQSIKEMAPPRHLKKISPPLRELIAERKTQELSGSPKIKIDCECKSTNSQIDSDLQEFTQWEFSNNYSNESRFLEGNKNNSKTQGMNIFKNSRAKVNKENIKAHGRKEQKKLELDNKSFQDKDTRRVSQKTNKVLKSSSLDKCHFRPKGITNPYYDCFINSVLQALFGVHEFILYFCAKELFKDNSKHLLNNNCFVEDSNRNQELSKNLKELMLEYFSDEPGPISNSAFRKLFDKEYPPSQQHDACQFIMHLFEHLQKEHDPPSGTFVSSGHKNGKEAWKRYAKSHTSIIDQLFIGMYQTVFTCEGCHEQVINYEEFNSIPINCYEMEENKGFEEWRDFTKFEDSQILCKTCKSLRNCTIQKKIIKFPKYLILSFQRLDPFTSSKIISKINFPTQFSPKYTLLSCIHHSGTLTSGHYTAMCKRNSEWFHLDDCTFTKISRKKIQTSDAYILLYEQQ